MKHKQTHKQKNPKQHIFLIKTKMVTTSITITKYKSKLHFEIGNKHTKYVLSLKAARNVFYWLLLEVGCYKKTSKVELQTEILKKIKMFSQ